MMGHLGHLGHWDRHFGISNVRSQGVGFPVVTVVTFETGVLSR